MSFKCGNCSTVQANGTKPIMVVTQTREKVYPRRYADPEHKVCIDNGGFGWEIVKEVPMCDVCASHKDDE